jgi:Gpi18-like mannosyltransferase
VGAARATVAQLGADRHPALLNRSAWRDAVAIWLGTRLLTILLALAGRWLVLGRLPSWPELLIPWASWDGAVYVTIATHGYVQPWVAAFFPLFPLVERAVSPVTGGSPLAAGVLIANATCLPAFALLWQLVEFESDARLARRVVLLLALFPTAFFLAAAYTESLFLLLSVASFLALRRHSILAAGIFAALATLSRPVGILLLVPLAWECVARLREPRLLGIRERLSMAAALALPVVALVGVWVYLAARFGSFSVMTQAEADTWGKHLTWPWVGLAQATSALSSESPLFRLHTGLDIAFTLLFLVLAVAALRRLRHAYGLYAAANAALVLVTPAQRGPALAWAALASNGRYLLVVFPCVWALALWAERPSRRVPLVALSLLLLALLTMMFANGVWVA